MRLSPVLAGLALATVPAAQGCPPTSLPLTIQGWHNPFLAGQPNGTTSKTDTAPYQSPFLVPVTIEGGQELVFEDATGNVFNDPGGLGPGPEGQTEAIQGSVSDLGISGYSMPINCLLGVFLDDTTNSGPAPPSLSFATPESRDFEVFAPELYQTFYIGDGLRNDGVTVQRFVAPANATRLYLGSADGYGWANNPGSFSMTFGSGLSLGACPASVSLMAGGTQTLELDAGSAFAGQTYLVLGSSLGTAPGLVLDGLEIPLVVDPYTLFCVNEPNAPPLSNTLGVLDAAGRATASVAVPAGLPAALAGTTLHHAFVAIELTPTLLALTFVSNTTSLALTL